MARTQSACAGAAALANAKPDNLPREGALQDAARPPTVSRYELSEEAREALPDEGVITRAFAAELDRSPSNGA